MKVWDAATGQQALSLKGHIGTVDSVAYSPDGKRIVSGGVDKTVKVWDAATGQEALSLKGHTGAVTSVAYSPDGKRIVSGCNDKTVKVWDAATSQDRLTFGRPFAAGRLAPSWVLPSAVRSPYCSASSLLRLIRAFPRTTPGPPTN